MVELVDTLVLGTSALRRGGSTPSCGTKGYSLQGMTLYFVKMVAGSYVNTQKLMLVK